MNTVTSSFASSIERLRGRFPRAEVRPAKPAYLPALRARFHDTRLLDSFYTECDGFDAGLHDSVCGHVFALERILKLPLLDPEQSRLVPLRSDGCGNFDCLVAGPGPLEGAVVFWDHEIFSQPAYLLAGSMQAYLEFLVDRLVHEFLPDGDRDPRYKPRRTSSWPFIASGQLTHPWPFDTDWLVSRDPEALRQLRDPAVQAWLARP